MKLDRSILKSVGFVRPSVNKTLHGRIPTAILESIGDIDAFAVYAILRMGGPKYCWKTATVKAVIDTHFGGSRGRGMGRTRVEKALKHLRQVGWIRYVDLLMPNGHQQGSIIEVQFSRLPQALRGKNRRIQFRHDWQFTVFEHDGTVVPEERYSPRYSSTKPDYPEEANEEESSQPLYRNPEERSPGNQASVEHYNGSLYKGSKILESPNPLSGKGDSDFLFDQDACPGENDVEPSGDPLCPDPGLPQPGEPVPVSPAPAPAPAPDPDRGTREVSVEPVQASAAVASPSASFDVQALWQMADAIKGDDDRRFEYEAFLLERVIPALKPPPEHDVWKKPDALDWCRTSAMGRLFLSLGKDSDWTPELARRFVKNSGTFTPDSMRTILLAGESPRKLSTLKELLNTSHTPARDHEGKILNHWKALCEGAREELQSVKYDLESTLQKFSVLQTDDLMMQSAVQWRKKLLSDDLCSDDEEPLFHAIRSFRAIQRSGDPLNHLQNAEVVARRDEQRPTLERAFASNLPHLAVAFSIPNCARVIWGVQIAELLILRNDMGRALKRRAEIHGITWDEDSNILTTTDRCKRIISQMPFDETASRLSQGEEWMKKHFPE